MTVPSTERVRAQRKLVIALCVVLALPGAVLSVATDHDLAILGGFLVGLAIILGSAWVFYEIGISEDRDREG